MSHQKTCGAGCVSFVFILAVAGANPWAVAADRPIVTLGEVTANDVYVRSGPSLNHYTIAKLGAGTRVKIYGERGGWYEIQPTEGTFSLISGEYVDSPDGKFGVVNGDNVRVRAGSLLNDNKYTVQAMLAKGAEVKVLGRNPDGFLRIAPPKDATLWINRDFVEPVPDSMLRLEQTRESNVDSGTSPPAEGAVVEPEGEETASKPASKQRDTERERLPLVALPRTTEYRKELNVIDAALQQELNKPRAERDYDSLRSRYQGIADQHEDSVSSEYALKRLEQVDHMAELSSAILRLRRLNEKAEGARLGYLQGRANMREPDMDVPAPLDARGVLRASALYSGGTSPLRYRLVDPSADGTRTIAYVEIPSDSGIDVNELMGRFVGVRSLRKRLLEGGVNPIPIYVAGEIVALDRPVDQVHSPGAN